MKISGNNVIKDREEKEVVDFQIFIKRYFFNLYLNRDISRKYFIIMMHSRKGEFDNISSDIFPRKKKEGKGKERKKETKREKA